MPYTFNLERKDRYPELLLKITKDILDASRIKNREKLYNQILSGNITWITDRHGTLTNN